jgi:hypothetical protein
LGPLFHCLRLAAGVKGTASPGFLHMFMALGSHDDEPAFKSQKQPLTILSVFSSLPACLFNPASSLIVLGPVDLQSAPAAPPTTHWVVRFAERLGDGGQTPWGHRGTLPRHGLGTYLPDTFLSTEV